jgi:hypothetical protein
VKVWTPLWLGVGSSGKSREHDPSGFIKGQGHFDRLSNYQLRRRDSVPCTLLVNSVRKVKK